MEMLSTMSGPGVNDQETQFMQVHTATVGSWSWSWSWPSVLDPLCQACSRRLRLVVGHRAHGAAGWVRREQRWRAAAMPALVFASHHYHHHSTS